MNIIIKLFNSNPKNNLLNELASKKGESKNKKMILQAKNKE